MLRVKGISKIVYFYKMIYEYIKQIKGKYFHRDK